MRGEPSQPDGVDRTDALDVVFSPPVVTGALVRRYKRFLAEVRCADGRTIVAHCPNSGSMLSVDCPGAPVWLSTSANAKRAYPHTWEIIEIGGTLVGINTSHPNAVVAQGLARGAIAELTGYARLRREVRYGARSRIDVLLEDDHRPSCLIEIKNVTMRRCLVDDAPCEFPDAVTARGTRHLNDLINAVESGLRAVLFFLVQRRDAGRVTIADDIDPLYGRTLRSAISRGVEVLAYRCDVSPSGLRLAERMEVLLMDESLA